MARTQYDRTGIVGTRDDAVDAVLSKPRVSSLRARAASLLEGIYRLRTYTPFESGDANGATALAWIAAHRDLSSIRRDLRTADLS
ncbi:MAG: hypothetical protein AAFQ53_00100 [Bacteroidota bacterium]